MIPNKIRATVVAFLVAFPATAEMTSPLVVRGAETVDVDRVIELYEDGAVFIDVRRASDVVAGRIPTSVHLDAEILVSEQRLADVVNRTDPVVFYCNGENCLRSSDVSARAVGWGYEQVFYFRDGYPAWDAARMPIQ